MLFVFPLYQTQFWMCPLILVRLCFPFQAMFINMTCENNSNRDITEVYMKLLQHTTYTTTTSTKTTTRDVTTYTGQPIPRRTSTTWVHRGLGIPPTQPTITTKLLTVWYQVRFLQHMFISNLDFENTPYL